MQIDTKEFERWVLSKNRSDCVEIDEKNLKQHFEKIINTKELSDLTLKQARVIATLMEHERLKVLEVDGKEEIKIRW